MDSILKEFPSASVELRVVDISDKAAVKVVSLPISLDGGDRSFFLLQFVNRFISYVVGIRERNPARSPAARYSL